jgi:hypothetical protein
MKEDPRGSSCGVGNHDRKTSLSGLLLKQVGCKFTVSLYTRKKNFMRNKYVIDEPIYECAER